MSKDKSDKKDKKEKKEKRQSTDGVTKEKKSKKDRKSTDATTALLNEIEDTNPGAVAVDADGDVTVDVDASMIDASDDKKTQRLEIPASALVPFASPLCDDKSGKKVLKTVKKGTF